MIAGFVALAVLAPAEISIRVEGEGYLRFLREGRAVFARSATLIVANGELREKSGPGFLPPIRISSGPVEVGEDGTVHSGPARIGRLYLARFSPEAIFEPSGTFFIARDRAELGFAQNEGLGRIVATRWSGGPEPLPSAIKAPVSPASSRPAPSMAKPSSAAQLTVQIPERVEVDGPRFSLGQIGKIEGDGVDLASIAAIDLGTAPVHGVPMNLSRERVWARLLYKKFDRRSANLEMPATVQVVRKGQIVAASQLIEAAKRAISDRYGIQGEMAADDRLSDLSVPEGKLDIGVESTQWSGGAASATLSIKVDSKRIAGRTIRLTGPSLEAVVAPGGPVTVRFIANGLSVELLGRAKAPGAIGQTIDVTVVAPGSRDITTHQGIVRSAGLVEVRL